MLKILEILAHVSVQAKIKWLMCLRHGIVRLVASCSLRFLGPNLHQVGEVCDVKRACPCDITEAGWQAGRQANIEGSGTVSGSGDY